MREYVENGARLGWLLDPEECKAYVYKPGESARILNTPDKLSGDPVLTGFILYLEADLGAHPLTNRATEAGVSTFLIKRGA